ncbi:MAG: outer membrane protein [Candidatus Eisenbacteria bacterium]
MRRLLIGTLSVGLLLSSGAAWAQQNRGVEIIPFAGYRWGGGMSTIPGVKKFETKDNWTFGLALDKRLAYNSAVEIYWSHFTSDFQVTLNPPLAGFTNPINHSMGRDDIMLNGVWYAVRDPGAPAVPYFTAGLGASIFSATGLSTVGRFGWNLGAGVRRQMNDRASLRLDARWLPTWVTTGSSVWCDYWYGCYTVGSGEFYDQFELSLGLIFKTGH